MSAPAEQPPRPTPPLRERGTSRLMTALGGPCPVMLAPMAGFTDAAMRQVCHEQGASFTFTEMVNAAGLLHDSQKTWQFLQTLPGEGAVAAHLYGTSPQILGEAAARVEAMGSFQAIDLNCGCPVRKIATKGAGAALMRTPQRIFDIVRAMHQATALPITVKTRLGLSPEAETIHEVAQAVEEAGGALLAIHARYASQGHSGPLRLDVLARVKQTRAIPVIGNGSLRTPADVRHMLAETGVDGVMIGRAAMGNPWIFAQIAADRGGVDWRPPDLDAIIRMLHHHLALEGSLKAHIYATFKPRGAHLTPAGATVMHFRAHLHRYLQGMQGASETRKRLNRLHTLDDVTQAVDAVIARERASGGGHRQAHLSGHLTH